MPFGCGKRVWVLGMLEGASGFSGGPASEVKLDDVPKPLVWCLRGSETFPVSRTPHLLGPPDSLRRGEQIPQVNVILRLIPGKVHGANLKPPELI